MIIKYLTQKYQETLHEWGESLEFIDIIERFLTGFFIKYSKSMQLYANRIRSNFRLFWATMLRIISLVMGFRFALSAKLTRELCHIRAHCHHGLLHPGFYVNALVE